MDNNYYSNFVVSLNLESIYYADLFNINGKIWMITGRGKSNAGMMASNNESEADLARDSVGLIRENDVLYGYYDGGGWHKDCKNEFKLQKIDYIAHCLYAEQSEIFYKNKNKVVVKTDNYLLALLHSEYQYTGFLAKGLCSEEKYNWLIDPQRRFNRFISLTNNITSTLFLVIPWMDSVKEKAQLYLEHVDIWKTASTIS